MFKKRQLRTAQDKLCRGRGLVPPTCDMGGKETLTKVGLTSLCSGNSHVELVVVA